ncbi:MAG: NAD(P)/FAD-dependent oxidoreductase [Candidatus Competibacterales bacterium]
MNTTPSTASVPSAATYVVVGAGVHGLSTAWHLAMALKAQGKGSGADILLVDRGEQPGSGATGVACGCVRNLYMTEPLHALVRHSVDVWLHDPVLFGFQQVGYISAGEENQLPDYERMVKSHRAVGYASDLYTGAEARNYLKNLWPDFRTDGIDVVLHEKPSGYAGTRQALTGLFEMCRRVGVNYQPRTQVTGYERTNGQVTAVHTDRGTVRCDAVVLAAGPWMPRHWAMLERPERLNVHYNDGTVAEDAAMWNYWRLEEGEVYFDGPYATRELRNPPVLHVELMNTPVRDPETQRILRDYLYVYFKHGTERMERPGLQGGSVPVKLGERADLEPYGHANPRYQADHPGFADYFCAALSALMGRFEGIRHQFKQRPNGGIGAFTPDNVPVLDWILPNVYMIADSNHGFKMTGIGKLVAQHLATGNAVAELTPFALSRYAEGGAFARRNSHSPWV